MRSEGNSSTQARVQSHGVLPADMRLSSANTLSPVLVLNVCYESGTINHMVYVPSDLRMNTILCHLQLRSNQLSA